jgi:Ca-activated chloride channel family protein
MAEEILLDYAIDKPNVSTTQEETDLKVLLKVNASNAIRAKSDQEVVANSHVALVLDVSSSMRAREMHALKEAARAAIDQLRPGDYVTVIAFQSVAYDIVEPTRILDSSTAASLKQKIDVIDQFQGGGTDMEYALTSAELQLGSVPDAKLVKKVIVFTDGQVTGVPEKCLKRAAEISGRGIGIDAVGFGKEFDYKFMQRLVSYSNGFTEYIEQAEDIASVFRRRVKNITTSIATNVRLDLTFTPQIRANRGYRYSPEISYLGKMRLPGDVRTISIPIGSVEKDKEYAYLVTCTVPAREAGKVRIVKAELFYDVPTLDVKDESSLQSVIVTYTDDPQALAQIDGAVEKAYDEVEIGRLVEELDASIDRQDTTHAAMLFDILAERYRELGDEEMAGHYVKLKKKWSEAGELSQEEMNYTRHKSTQKRDSGVQLVDASSLI